MFTHLFLFSFFHSYFTDIDCKKYCSLLDHLSSSNLTSISVCEPCPPFLRVQSSPHLLNSQMSWAMVGNHGSFRPHLLISGQCWGTVEAGYTSCPTSLVFSGLHLRRLSPSNQASRMLHWRPQSSRGRRGRREHLFLPDPHREHLCQPGPNRVHLCPQDPHREHLCPPDPHRENVCSSGPSRTLPVLKKGTTLHPWSTVMHLRKPSSQVSQMQH